MADDEARRSLLEVLEVREEESADVEEARDVADDEARRAEQPGPADDELRRELGEQLVRACVEASCGGLSVEEVADLLRRGADVEYENWDKSWPLRNAAHYGRTDVARALLEHGADVNHTNEDGDTALQIAVLEDKMDLVKVLLERAGEKLPPPYLVTLLSKFFVQDGGDPIDVANVLLQRVAGQGVNGSDAAFAECRAPGGLDIWFEKGSAEKYKSGGKTHLVTSVNGDPKTVLGELQCHAKWPGRLFNRFSRLVKVDLCEARTVTMDVLDDRKLMDALATTSNLELFNTELVQCMVRYMWDTVMLWAYLDIFMNAGIVASACTASAALSRGEDVDGLSWTILVAATSKRVAEEFLQLCHALRSAPFDESWFSKTFWMIVGLPMFLLSRLIGHALQLDMVLDTAFISLSVVSLRILDEAEDVSPSNRFVLALWFALLWLRLLNSLRVLRLVGPRFLPIFYTIRGTLGFYFVVAFTFAASVHSYYTLAVRDYPGPFYAAFVQMFKLYFLGDFDLQELEGVDPSYVQTSGAGARLILEPRDPDASENYAFVHGIFYAVALLFAVVLMNLFIGIPGAEYDIQEDVAIPVFLQSRVVAAAKYRSLPWVGACSWVYRRFARHDGKQHLCALVRCAPSDDATRSLRSQLSLTERKINETVDKKTSGTDKKIATLDRKLKGMGQNMKDMNKKMDVLLKLLKASGLARRPRRR